MPHNLEIYIENGQQRSVFEADQVAFTGIENERKVIRQSHEPIIALGKKNSLEIDQVGYPTNDSFLINVRKHEGVTHVTVIAP